jgi:hypothetical protein
MSDPTPSDPKMEGDSEVLHDGMNDAGHEAQLPGKSSEEQNEPKETPEEEEKE